MKYPEGQNRFQQEIQTRCLDVTVKRGAEVRVIDAFVGALDMAKMGFRADHIDNGRPAYRPADMLRLFLYGHRLQPYTQPQAMWNIRRYKGVWGILAGYWSRKETPKIFFNEGVEGLEFGVWKRF